MLSMGSSALVDSFLELREKNMMVLKSAKESGKKVVGIYCTYGPRELVLAADAIPVGLCGTREEPIPAAENHLPRNLCPLIKSSYGFAVTGSCPYFYFSDLIIGETTCDGKKKMFELMQRMKPVHVLNMPQNPDLPASVDLMYREMVRLQEAIESVLGLTISKQGLREAIHVVNEGNRALKELFDLNRAKPAVISGLDLLRVAWQIGFHTDRWERVTMLDALVNKIKAQAAKGQYIGTKSTPRVLLTGTPVGMGSEKVVSLVEESGGLVVAMENCGGYKTLGIRIDETDQRDPLLLLAEKYLSIPCSVMSPNTGRLDLLKRMAADFQIDGVIDLTWQACHTYNIESYWISKLVKEELSLPYLHLETDYSQNDRAALKIRISAFLEMIN